MVTYISPEFGELLKKEIYRRFRTLKECAEFLSQNLPGAQSTHFQHLIEYCNGNFLGAAYHLTQGNAHLFDDYILKLVYAINCLEVSPDSKLVQIIRDEIKREIDYPPVEEYPDLRRKRKF